MLSFNHGQALFDAGRKGRKFIYACHAILPSGFAHSVQVANMASEFVKLYSNSVAIFRMPWAKMGQVRDVFAYYGVHAPAIYKVIPSVRCLDWTAFYLVFFAIYLWMSPRSSIVYTRTPKVAQIAASLGMRTVLELHNPLSERHVSIIHSVIRRDVPFRVIVTTLKLKDDVMRMFKIREAMIHVASSGANERMLAIRPAPLPGAYAYNVGYAGSAFKGKGVEVILKCAALMPDVGFHIIGPSMKQCARRGGLRPNVFVHGRLPNLECAALLKAMDCLMLPNQRHVYIKDGTDIGAQTSPLKKFEYMALGRPIVASNIPILREVLKDGVNCLLCEPEDIDGFCRIIRRFREDGRLAESLGDAARREFETHYSWAIRAKNIMRFLAVSEEAKNEAPQAAAVALKY